MKHDLRIIGYITFTIFILLWINQLFSGIKLYETVKTRWQIHMYSIIESIIPPVRQHASSNRQVPKLQNTRVRHNTGKNLPEK